jgi:hypothetical protein
MIMILIMIMCNIKKEELFLVNYWGLVLMKVMKLDRGQMAMNDDDDDDVDEMTPIIFRITTREDVSSSPLNFDNKILN